MSQWTQEELDRINGDEWFHLSAALPDGSTPKTVDIWSVGVGDRIFVRSYNGTAGKWYSLALESGKGRISAGAVTKNVSFVKVDDEEAKKLVDTAYRTKYAHSKWGGAMADDPVRDNTIEVVSAE